MRNHYTYSIIIIGVLFFIFGFVTWLNGTLILFLKLVCNLQTDAQALLVTFAFYLAYFFLAIPSSYILRVTGFKRGMALGLLVMAAGALLFVPAAQNRHFLLFLTGLFVQGMGLALLQTASNPYIAILGPLESAAKRISIMGICNKVAGALGPLFLSAIVLRSASEAERQLAEVTDVALRAQLLDGLAQRVVTPYIGMAIVLVFLAVLIALSSLPEIELEREGPASSPPASFKTSILQFPHLLLGAVCIFVYVGAEVMAGDVIGTYGNALGLSLDQTKNFTSYTLWAMVIGYILGVLTIPRYLRQDRALLYSALTGIVFSLAAFLTTGYLSILFIALLGLANALMWPSIFPLAITGLGRFTKIGSAVLIMGIVGGAILPQIYGYLVQPDGPALPAATAFFVCILPCYLFITFYALRGHKIGLATKTG